MALVTVATALDIAKSIDYGQLVETLELAGQGGLEIVDVDVDENGNLVLDEPTAVLVGLHSEGAPIETLLDLGDAAQLTDGMESLLLAAVAQNAHLSSSELGTLLAETGFTVEVLDDRPAEDAIGVAVGGRFFSFPVDGAPYVEPEPDEISKGVTIAKATTEERIWRYTLGPVYIPGLVDAHGDHIDADDLEEAIHEYVRSGDREIRLQHDTSVRAGEWVGLLTWPWPVTVPVMDEGVMKQRTFPAGTPFMGVQWDQDVWDKLVVPGHIRGYSLGGIAQFATAEVDDQAAKAFSSTQPRDANGRWTSGFSGGAYNGADGQEGAAGVSGGSGGIPEGVGPARDDSGRGHSPGDRARVVLADGTQVATLGTLEHSPEVQALADDGLKVVTLHELDPAKSAGAFRQQIAELKKTSKFASSVYVYDEGDYADMRLFLNDDGTAGIALHGDEVVSGFVHKGSKDQGGMRSMLRQAREQGGRRLDAFDTVLPTIYQAEGFEPVARVPFDDNYKPDGWDYGTYARFNGGRPDVVFMRFNPDMVGSTYVPGTGAYVASYDDGVAAARVAKYSATQPRDANGRWTSGGGGGISSSSPAQLTANPETGYRMTAHAEADRLHAEAVQEEPAITATLETLAKDGGGRLIGLPFKFKEPKSMARKINNEANARGVDDITAAAGIGDALRYTMEVDAATHTAAAKKTLDTLEAQGMKLRVKNYWVPGDPYQGINAVITTPEGFQWELQFHTAESFRVKDSVNHKLYEEYRTSKDDGRRAQLWDEMVGNANTITVPEGIHSIETLKVQTFETAEQAGLLK